MIYESAIMAFDYLSSWINNRRYRLRVKQTEFDQELLDAYK
ncbi:MAG: hypothetical protein P8X83_08605 [Nitrosopumilaceae archaeon]